MESQLAAVETSAGPTPSDSSDVRRHARRMVVHELGEAAMGAGFWFLLIHVSGLPAGIVWPLIGVFALRWGAKLAPLRSAAGRARWRADAASSARVDEALRSHVSIGAEDHLVTDRAAEDRKTARVVLVGAVLITAVLVRTLVARPPAIVGHELEIVLVVSLCWLVPAAFAVRSLHRARRWLLDPPPLRP